MAVAAEFSGYAEKFHCCFSGHTVPYGTVAFEGRFSRHFVPGYNRLSLRDALADISQQP
jgi:hypothetical protein